MKRLLSALILVGVSSMISQIVLIRELLILFYGNELSIGIVLANWLWWTSCGSWLAGFTIKKSSRPLRLLALAEITLAFILVVTVSAIRGSKSWFGVTPGEILGLISIWSYSFFLLSGSCLLNGFLFVAACRSYCWLLPIKESGSPVSGDGAGVIGRVYVLEAVGAGAGGICCAFFLLKYFNALQIVWLVAVLNLIIANFIWGPGKARGRVIIAAITAVFVIFGAAGGISWWQKKTRDWQWPGYRVLVSADSIYGNITVTERGPQLNFYENGLLTSSVPDLLTAEESVHLAMLQVPGPEDVLLIGSGINGATREILKYPSLRSLTYIELDPLLIKLAESVLPPPDMAWFLDPRLHFYFGDGRRFLKTSMEKFDVIIVNLPDPYTAQINRFYTVQFFEQAARHLRSRGVLGFGISGTENYISPILGDLLRCIFYSLRDVFPQVKVLPGEDNYFIAGNQDADLTDVAAVIERRMAAAGVETKYVRDYYLSYRLTGERKEYLQRHLSRGGKILLNTDFHPVSYFYDIVFWSTYFSDSFQRIFLLLAKLKLWHFLLVVLLACCLLFVRRNSKAINGRYVLLPIMISGFSEISFQVVTILAFQVIYGYVYYKLGFILTSFMIGLALGGYFFNHLPADRRNDYYLFFAAQVAITIYPLLLPLVFSIFAGVTAAVISWFGENIIFPVLPVIAGFVGGFQFPLGNRIYLQQRGSIVSAAGITYGIDLFGACAGALVLSALLLPVLGIWQICLATALINFSALLIIFRYRPRGRLAG